MAPSSIQKITYRQLIRPYVGRDIAPAFQNIVRVDVAQKKCFCNVQKEKICSQGQQKYYNWH